MSGVGMEDEHGGRIIELVTDNDGEYDLVRFFFFFLFFKLHNSTYGNTDHGREPIQPDARSTHPQKKEPKSTKTLATPTGPPEPNATPEKENISCGPKPHRL